MSRYRPALVAAAITVPVAWAGLVWAAWFFDGCRGLSYRGGGCGDFDAIEPFFRLALVVPAVIITAAVGLLVAAGGRVRSWAAGCAHLFWPHLSGLCSSDLAPL